MSTKGSFYSNGTQVYTDTNPAGPADTPIAVTPSPAPSSFYGGTGQPYANVETMNATLAEVDTALTAVLTAETSAVGSAAAAATSATNAATSEGQASVQAANAAASASAASASETNAAASASAAAGSAGGASTSATSAASSAAAAASSASAASTSEANAAASATGAASSASSASASATSAANSATSAATAADTEIANRAIRYDAAQALTGPQQTQARSNAGITSLSLTISGHLVSLGGTLTLAPADAGLGNVTNDAQTKAAIVPNTVPTNGQVPIGNGTAYAPQAISGDGTLSSTGALVITKTNGTAFGTAATLNVGTAAGNVVRLDPTTGKLPAVDGSLLLNLAAAPPATPGGRLTLTSATAVTSSDVVGAVTVYYTPCATDRASLYSGTAWASYAFTELSLALDATSTDTGYHQSGKNFDFFLAISGGAPILGTGPAWTSDSARGTGSGTTELQLLNGLWVNKNSITLRTGSATGNTLSVPANQALYLGTFRATANGVTEDSLAKRFLYNAYNQVRRNMRRAETTQTWSTNQNGTWRQANASTLNQLNFVLGLSGSEVSARVQSQVFQATAAGVAFLGIGLNSTTANSAVFWDYISLDGNGYVRPGSASYSGYPGVGYNFLAWLENTTNNSFSFYGLSPATPAQYSYGIHGEVWL